MTGQVSSKRPRLGRPERPAGASRGRGLGPLEARLDELTVRFLRRLDAELQRCEKSSRKRALTLGGTLGPCQFGKKVRARKKMLRPNTRRPRKSSRTR
jgi:hypothetical protein